MAKYRVKPGYTYGAYGTFKEGDIVELLEVDAGPFLDKLEIVPTEAPSAPEPVSETVEESDVVLEPEAGLEPEAEQEDVSEVPEQPAEVKRTNRKKV